MSRAWGQVLETVFLLDRTGGIPSKHKQEAERIRTLLDKLALEVVSPRSAAAVDRDRHRRRLYRAFDGVWVRTGEQARFEREIARRGGGSC